MTDTIETTEPAASDALYARQGAYIPRIAAVHDLCGYGKCSLGVAIPVLSAAGCDVCPVPTGLFSSHTAFPGWYMHDTTDILADYLNAWKGIDVDIDAVYSGFLGAPEQVDIIRGIYGDNLSVCAACGRSICPIVRSYHLHARAVRCDGAARRRRRHPHAQPHRGGDHPGQAIGDARGGRRRHQRGGSGSAWSRRLLAKGAKNVVLKGIQRAGRTSSATTWAAPSAT